MSELSTADLAGGGAPRPRVDERDPAMGRRPDFDGRDDHANQRDLEDRPVDADTRTFDAQPVGTGSAIGTMPPQRPSGLANPAATDGAMSGDAHEPLFPSREADTFRTRWLEVQTGFVDEPRYAVEQADGLVAEMMQRLARVFADERASLEEQWSRGDDISTEDLRQALRRYRSFFDRLLSV